MTARYTNEWLDWLILVALIALGSAISLGGYGVVSAYTAATPTPAPRDIRAEQAEAVTMLFVAQIGQCGTAAPTTELAADALGLVAPYGEPTYSLATVARIAEERAAAWCGGRR